MKAFFYFWCVMAVIGIIASFFNFGHLYFTFMPSVAMACILYPEIKEAEDYE